jgi:hypothetical protein
MTGTNLEPGESEVISEEPKTCFVVPCPSFQEFHLHTEEVWDLYGNPIPLEGES